MDVLCGDGVLDYAEKKDLRENYPALYEFLQNNPSMVKNIGKTITFNSPSFKNLDEAQQQQLIDIYKTTDVKGRKNLGKIFNSSNFKNLDKAQQQQLIDIYLKTNEEGRENLTDLLNRNIDGKSALLDTDKDGKTLLSNLHTIANQKLTDEVKADSSVTREQLLSTIIQETGMPGQINQSNRGTCPVASMQYMLCDENPAEYARLMSGLLSPKGEVTMRNGDELTRDENCVVSDSATNRSASERIFQSSMMEYANGNETYDDQKYHIAAAEGLEHNAGLNADQQEYGLEALFGKNFDKYAGDDKQDIVDKLTKRSGTNTFVAMKWGQNQEGGHDVVVTRVDEKKGRVYFRNPWGPDTVNTKGHQYQDPPRSLEDPATGEESMSINDFKNWVKYALIPDN